MKRLVIDLLTTLQIIPSCRLLFIRLSSVLLITIFHFVSNWCKQNTATPSSYHKGAKLIICNAILLQESNCHIIRNISRSSKHVICTAYRRPWFNFERAEIRWFAPTFIANGSANSNDIFLLFFSSSSSREEEKCSITKAAAAARTWRSYYRNIDNCNHQKWYYRSSKKEAPPTSTIISTHHSQR